MTIGLIPRLYPSYRLVELVKAAAHMTDHGARERFESLFCERSGLRYARAFAYGRSALYFLLKALSIENKEIIIPAYTCEVVAAAVVISGNVPRFVDVSMTTFTMTRDAVRAAMTEQTAAVLATDMYGIPMDGIEELATECRARGILLIQDWALTSCALTPQKLSGDAAIISFSTGKVLSTIEGGMVATNSDDVAHKIKAYTDRHAHEPSLFEQWCDLVFGLLLLIGLHPWVYRFTRLLARWGCLQRVTVIFDERTIALPRRAHQRLAPCKAQLGIYQLMRSARELTERRARLAAYRHALTALLPTAVVTNETLVSHVPVLCNDRVATVGCLCAAGIEGGDSLFNYVVPRLRSYTCYAGGADFPVADMLARHATVWPMHRLVMVRNITSVPWPALMTN